jgi:hypothetical protein
VNSDHVTGRGRTSLGPERSGLEGSEGKLAHDEREQDAPRMAHHGQARGDENHGCPCAMWHLQLSRRGRFRPFEPASALSAVIAAIGEILAILWQATLSGSAADALCLGGLRGFEPLTPCMPCSFGLLPHPRSGMCAQPNGLLGVTVTVRCIPLVTAAYGTRVARPARTTRLAPEGNGSQLA